MTQNDLFSIEDRSQLLRSLAEISLRIPWAHVTITQATAPLYKKPVVLSFTAQGTWVYAVGKAEQEHIKSSTAGKTKQAALHILQSLLGIEQASLTWSDDTKLPKDPNTIHLLFIFRT